MSTQEIWIKSLMELVPGTEWQMSGNTYEGLTWLDENTTKPTQEDLEAKVTELEGLVDITALREVRNAKLAETDWVVTMHKELGTNIPAAWKTYRQALRDITDTYTSLDDVVWPEKP